MKQFLLLAAFGCAAFGQNANIFVTTSGDVSLTASSSTTLTIQQPATGAKTVQLWRASASCDTQAFSVQQYANGSAATATAAAITATSPIKGTPTPTPTVTAWSASNVGAGTALWSTLSYSAGPAALDLSQLSFLQTGTGTNYSITLTNTSASTCTGRITIQWKEGDLLNGAVQSIP